jgi:carboxyl-terminal processing protease
MSAPVVPTFGSSTLAYKNKQAPALVARIEGYDAEKDIYQWFKTYSEVVGLVEKKAFRQVDFGKFIQGSLKAAAGEIDAHTAFLSKDSYQAAMESTSGEFSGIGVSIISKSSEDEALVIIDVIRGGPAAKAGLKSGDKIVSVNGEKLKALSTDEAVNKLKGKPGSTVTLKILRNRKPLEFKVVRDIVKDVNSICFLFKDFGVYYMSLKMFTEDAAKQIKVLLTKANQGRCKGLVLDLRRNPGGTLQSAIEMAGLFLEKNSLVVVTKDRNRNVVEKYYTSTQPILKSDVPIFILIDNFTASAAEILAGCLRYYAMNEGAKKGKKQQPLYVFLVGVPTFGKGSVQEVIPLSNGCAIKLTTMLYYLPGDSTIQATGIEPDFMVKPRLMPVNEMKWIAEMYGKETSLKAHITVSEATGKPEVKKEQPKPAVAQDDSLVESVDADGGDEGVGKVEDPTEDTKSWEEKLREELSHDIQVQTAISMISLLDVARATMPQAINTRQKAIDFMKKHHVTDDLVAIEEVK